MLNFENKTKTVEQQAVMKCLCLDVTIAEYYCIDISVVMVTASVHEWYIDLRINELQQQNVHDLKIKRFGSSNNMHPKWANK